MKRVVWIFGLAILMSVPAALADWDGYDLSKWAQMPDLDSTGIDVNASADFVLADDFLCTETDSITNIHIWGSWYHEYLPQNSPDAVVFLICFYADIPDSLSPTGYSMPGEVLWSKSFSPGEFTSCVWSGGHTGGWLNPPVGYEFPADTTCYQYNFPIPEAEFFYQTGAASAPIVYWLSVQAIPLDPVAVFGWKTSYNHWNDDAVWGQGDQPIGGPWYELRYPPGHDMAGESVDLAFVIVGETYGIDWGDAPDTLGAPYYPTLAAHNGASHIIRGPYFELWGLDEPDEPDEEPDGQPDPPGEGDDLDGNDDEDGLFTTVAVRGAWMSIEYGVVATDTAYADAWVDWDIDGAWESPEEEMFYLWTSGGTILCSSRVPVPADAAVGWTYARMRINSSGPLPPDGPAEDGEVEDHPVHIVDYGEFKWLQTPYLGYHNVDVRTTHPFILADDFLCAEARRITEITVWGSWKDDYLPFGDSPDSVRFILSFHDNIPDSLSGVGYAMPGNLLWMRTFVPGQFSASVESAGVDGGWLVPPDLYSVANDTTCWRYKFPILAQEAFLQEGTLESPVRYWLDVQAWPMDEDAFFGWKGSADHWHANAVYGSGMEPYPGPWYLILDRYGRDLAFMLRADPASEVPDDTAVPGGLGLMQNRPNPFTGSTTIQYALTEGVQVKLEVFEVTGRLVTVLADDVRSAGVHSVVWDGHDADGNEQPTGIYFYRLTAGGRRETRKVLLLR